VFTSHESPGQGVFKNAIISRAGSSAWYFTQASMKQERALHF